MPRVIVKKIEDREEKILLPVAKDEEVVFVLIGLEAGEKQIIIELRDEGARAEILGIFVLHGGEIKVRTTQHHLAPNTTSDLLFKTVLLGKADFNYHGLIKINTAAQGANAYQRNDSLLLHEQAKVKTKPELEILANEVRCTHGATVGRLDEDQIYYLMTRGLGREKAVRVLLAGFLGEALARIKDDTKREAIKRLVIRNLKSEWNIS